MTVVLPIVPGGIAEDAISGYPPQLIGSRCRDCGVLAYPQVDECCGCGGPTTRVGIGSTGTIYSFTAVRVKPPLGLPSPYWIGYVDLDEVPLRVLGLLDVARSDYRIGQPVELRVGQLGVGADGLPCRRPYFAARADILQEVP